MKKSLLCASLLLCLKYGRTQSGLPDPSFGKNGIVTTDMGTQFKYANSARQVLVTPDGSIYINLNGSFTGTSISKRFANGAIDSSFGINGYSKAIASLSEVFLHFSLMAKLLLLGQTIPVQGYPEWHDWMLMDCQILLLVTMLFCPHRSNLFR